jgi:hypothetical protein
VKDDHPVLSRGTTLPELADAWLQKVVERWEGREGSSQTMGAPQGDNDIEPVESPARLQDLARVVSSTLVVTSTPEHSLALRRVLGGRLVHQRPTHRPADDGANIPSWQRLGSAALRQLSSALVVAPFFTPFEVGEELLLAHGGNDVYPRGLRRLHEDETERWKVRIVQATLEQTLAEGDRVLADWIARRSFQPPLCFENTARALARLHTNIVASGVRCVDVHALDVRPLDGPLSLAAAFVAWDEAFDQGHSLDRLSEPAERARTHRRALAALLSMETNSIADFASAARLTLAQEAKAAELATALRQAIAEAVFLAPPQDQRKRQPHHRSSRGRSRSPSPPETLACKREQHSPVAPAEQPLVRATEQLLTALVDHVTGVTTGRIRDVLCRIDDAWRDEKVRRGVHERCDVVQSAYDLLRSDTHVRAEARVRFSALLVGDTSGLSGVEQRFVSSWVALLSDSSSPPSTCEPQRRRNVPPHDPDQGVRLGPPPSPSSSSSWLSTPLRALASTIGDGFLQGHDVLAAAGNDGGPCGAWWCGAEPSPSEEERLIGRKMQSTAEPVDLASEARIVAHGVAGLLSRRAGPRPAWYPEKASDVVVLVRQSQAIDVVARALLAAGLPVAVDAAGSFWTRPEIVDVTQALELVLRPDNPIAAWAVLRSPFVAVPDDQVMALFEALPRGVQAFSWAEVVAAVDDDLVARDVAARVLAFDELLVSLRQQVHCQKPRCLIDGLLVAGGYAAACAVEHDGPRRLRHLDALRAWCDAREHEDNLVVLARLLQAGDQGAPAPALPLGNDRARGVRVTTLQAWCTSPQDDVGGVSASRLVGIFADLGSESEDDEAVDVAFAPGVGLATGVWGRPIGSCLAPLPSPAPSAPSMAPSTATLAAETAMTRVQSALRRQRQDDDDALLRVAFSRMCRGAVVVGNPAHKSGKPMLARLEKARFQHPVLFHRLLPVEFIDVEPFKASLSGAHSFAYVDEPAALDNVRAGAALQADGPLWAQEIPSGLVGRFRRRVDVRLLVPAEQSQLSLFSGRVDDWAADARTERMVHELAPMARAVLAWVTTERPEALDTGLDARVAVRDALRALQAPPWPRPGERASVDDVAAVFEDRLVRTLRGPLRALRDEGRRFSFEEALVLCTDELVVSTTVGLVARGGADDLVIGIEASKTKAASKEAFYAVQVGCAALHARNGSKTRRYAVWCLGDLTPPSASTWGRGAQRELAAVLQRAADLRR